MVVSKRKKTEKRVTKISKRKGDRESPVQDPNKTNEGGGGKIVDGRVCRLHRKRGERGVNKRGGTLSATTGGNPPTVGKRGRVVKGEGEWGNLLASPTSATPEAFERKGGGVLGGVTVTPGTSFRLAWKGGGNCRWGAKPRTALKEGKRSAQMKTNSRKGVRPVLNLKKKVPVQTLEQNRQRRERGFFRIPEEGFEITS